MSEMKSTIAVEVDASGVQTGVSAVKKSLADLGEAATSAGVGFNGVSTQADEALKKADRSTKAFVAQVKNAATDIKAEVDKLSIADKFELKAVTKGLDPSVYKPYVEYLRTVSAAQDRMATSANGAAMSARAMTNAMRGVPAQFTDIVTSLSSGQSAMTVLMQQGGQLKDMFGGVGNAAKALGTYMLGLINPVSLTVAAVGALGYAAYSASENVRALQKAIILSGAQLGTSTSQLNDVARGLQSLGVSSSVASAALVEFINAGAKVNDQLKEVTKTAIDLERLGGVAIEETAKKFVALAKDPLADLDRLTLSTYKQIEALLEQGKRTEAVAVAQAAFQEANKETAKALAASLGPLDTAISAWKRYGAAIWDSVKAASSAVAGAFAPITGDNERSTLQSRRDLYAKQGYDTTQEDARLEYFRKLDAAQQQTLKNIARETELKTLLAEVDKNDQGAKKLRERNKLVEDYTKLVDAGLKSQAQFTEALRQFDEKNTKKVAAAKPEDTGTYADIIKSIREKIEVQAQEAAGIEKLTKGEREQAKFLADLRDGTTGLVAIKGKSIQQQTIEIVQAYQAQIALEKENEAIARSEALRRSAAQAIEAYTKKQVDETAAINAKAQSIEDEVAAYGLTKEALRQLTIARLEEQAAQITRFEPAEVAQKEVAAIEARIAALKRLGAAETARDVKEANAKAAEDARKEWQKTAEKINDSITDALMRGFESGKGFAENLRDTVVNLFKTMVLRPTISALVNPVAQGITGAMGLSGTANAASTVSTLTGVGNFASGLAAFGGTLATGFMNTLVGSGMSAGLTSAGAMIANGAWASGLGMAAGALGPLALGVAALSSLIKSNGGTPTSNTGNAAASFDPLGNRIGYETFYGGSSANVDNTLAGLQATYQRSASALGIGTVGTRFSFGGNTGKNGESPNFALGSSAGGVNFYQGETASSAAAIELAASRAVFAALQGSELPKYIAQVFNGLSASAMTKEQIESTLAYAQSLKQVREALLETREPLQILKDNVAQGFATLATSADTFKADFVAAIDAGISPERLAQWQNLQNAMTELAAASGKAAESVRSVADILNERKRLQDQLDELTLTSTELLEKQRLAIDASNRSLFDQVQAAQTARNTLDQRNALEEQLLQLQGNTTELRRRELESIAPSNRALQESIYALEDAKAAQEAYNTALSSAQGRLASASSALANAQNAVDAIRSTGTDQYLNALQQVTQAQDAIAAAAQDAAQKMAQLGQSLREFVAKEVLTTAAGGPSIAVANQAFARTLAQARAGDVTAIGDLESRGRTAIEAARAGSSTSAQYQAIRNTILQGVASVASSLPAAAAQGQGADLQQRLIDSQVNLAEALRVANAIGAPLQRAQDDLIAKFAAAQTELASAQAEYAAASAVLDAIKNNTAQTAANVQALNGNLVVQLQASAQSEITKLITVVGDDSSLSADIKTLVLMESESISKYIDLIATSSLTPDLKTLALLETSSIVKSLDLIARSAIPNDIKVLALMENESISKAISLVATSSISEDQKALALMGSASVSKYISLITNSNLSTDDKTLALMASNSIVKTINTALGANDSTALSIALAHSDTLVRTISAVGGTLTDDQRTVLQALTGASSVSVTVSGATTASVSFDPADPIRSVWASIRDLTAQSAQSAYGMHSALSWIASMISNMLNHISTVHMVFNRGDGQVFAKGGVFTNKVVDGPTTFDPGLMGEAGPEAIMPLRRTPDGSLGVIADIDYKQFGRGNDALVAEIRTLREENRAQASAIVGLNQRMTKLMERWDGNGLPSTRVEA